MKNERIRQEFIAALKNSAMRQDRVAEMLGLKPDTLSKWKRGIVDYSNYNLLKIDRFNEKYQKPISILD